MIGPQASRLHCGAGNHDANGVSSQTGGRDAHAPRISRSAYFMRRWGRPTMKTLVRTVLLLWATFLLMHAYYLLLAVREVPHPSYIPLAGFVVVELVALLATLGIGTWFVILGSNTQKGIRLKAFFWILLGILPAFIWYSQVSLSFQYMEDRSTQAVEPTWYLCTSETIGNALVDGIGRYTLPYKLEGKKVVMFYDAQVQDPLGDVAKMDAFIQSEEKAIGVSVPYKIHWFRGPVFGMPGFAMNGIAVADPAYSHSYDETSVKDAPGTLYYVDFHEIAHNILPCPTMLSFLGKNCPPGFLIEGWAEARTSPYEYLAYACRELKSNNNALLFRVLASPKYYFQIENRVYRQGGAFVHFLMNTYGMEKFRELFTNCSMPTFCEDFEKVYGLSLDQAEKLFWEDIQKSFSFAKATETLSEDEKELLQNFREVFKMQTLVYEKLISQGTFHWKNEFHYQHENGVTNLTSDSRFCAMDEKHFREDTRYTRSDSKNENGKGTTLRGTTISILFPEQQYVFSQSSKEPNKSDSQTHKIDPSVWLAARKNYLKIYMSNLEPLSLFTRGSSLDFTNPELFFWNPSSDTTIRNVIKDQGDIVRIHFEIVNPNVPIVEKLVLDLDSNRQWILLKAEHQHLIENVVTRTRTDLREYEGEFHEIPLLKKQTYRDEVFGEHPSVSTNTIELVHHDTLPVPESEFYKGVNFEISKEPTTWNAKKMLQRDLTIIAVWLFIACVGIFITRKKREP